MLDIWVNLEGPDTKLTLFLRDEDLQEKGRLNGTDVRPDVNGLRGPENGQVS